MTKRWSRHLTSGCCVQDRESPDVQSRLSSIDKRYQDLLDLAKLRKQRLIDALSLYKLFNESDGVETWIDEKVGCVPLSFMILYCFDFFWLVVTSWFACCFILVRKEQFPQHIRHGTDSELSSFSIIKVQVFTQVDNNAYWNPWLRRKEVVFLRSAWLFAILFSFSWNGLLYV